MHYKRYFLISMISALVISALIGIYIFLFGEGMELEMKVLATTLCIGIYSLLGLCNAALQTKKGMQYLSLSGIIVSLIAFIISLVAIWIETEARDIWREAAIAFVIATMFAHVSLLLLIKHKSSLTKYPLIITMLFIVAVGIMMINGIIGDFDQSDAYFRIMGVFAILDVLGTITIPLLNKLTEKKPSAEITKQVRKWVNLFNSADADALAEMYHDDAINHQVANEAIHGKDAILEMFRSEFAQAKMVCIIENIYEDGDWGILEWKDPQGLRGCGFFHFANGKIKLQRGYWDKLSFLRQHNLPFPTD